MSCSFLCQKLVVMIAELRETLAYIPHLQEMRHNLKFGIFVLLVEKKHLQMHF